MTRKAPCANLLLLPLTETLRNNNVDDDNGNGNDTTTTGIHTSGTVHAATRCLSSSPHARPLASSTLLFVSPRHRETRKQTTAVEDASCLQESSTLFHWAELVVVAGEKGDIEGERGTHIHSGARARVPTGGNERKREGEREKERDSAAERHNPTTTEVRLELNAERLIEADVGRLDRTEALADSALCSALSLPPT